MFKTKIKRKDMGQLIITQGPKQYLDRVFLLSKDEQRLLGRSSICHFRIEDLKASSLHCLFRWAEDGFEVLDLLSANGLFVNNQLVEKKKLEQGDNLRFGNFILEFVSSFDQQEDKMYITGEIPDISGTSNDEMSFPPIEETSRESEQVPLGRQIFDSKDLNICKLALKRGLIEHGEIRELLAEKGKEQKTIAELIVIKNWLTQEDLDNLLDEHKYLKVRSKDLRFAQAAVEKKLLEESQVQECLALQERYFKEEKELPRLSELLVQKSYISIQENNRLLKSMMKKRQEK